MSKVNKPLKDFDNDNISQLNYFKVNIKLQKEEYVNVHMVKKFNYLSERLDHNGKISSFTYFKGNVGIWNEDNVGVRMAVAHGMTKQNVLRLQISVYDTLDTQRLQC